MQKVRGKVLGKVLKVLRVLNVRRRDTFSTFSTFSTLSTCPNTFSTYLRTFCTRISLLHPFRFFHAPA